MNYQRQHVSMEESNKAISSGRTSRRVVFLICLPVVFYLAFAFTVRTIRNKHGARNGGPAVAPAGGKSIVNDDDDVVDDDSLRIAYVEPTADDDAPAAAVNKLGRKNIKALSKATVRANATFAGCESTVMLMRHCEKEGGTERTDADGNEHCDYVGHERAQWFPSMFGPGRRWPVPAYLYALSPNRGSKSVYRSVETLAPLAGKFGLDIHKDYQTNNEMVDGVFEVLASGDACGKLTIVNWRHHMLPNLARKLGCQVCPSEYPSHSFDQVWQLKFVWNVAETEIGRKNNDEDMENQPDGPSASSSSSPPQLRRELKTKNKKEKLAKPLWSVYATVTEQNFDPLQFSNTVGDYVEGGSKIGGTWLNIDQGEM